MLDGDFERAWTISDAVMRQRAGQSCADLPYHLRWVWDGAAFCGRNVLVRCYHGLGDTLQFIRFVPKLAAMARSVMVEAQPALLPLLSSVRGISALYPLGAAIPTYEVAIELMELPHALRIRLDDLPGPIPYLTLPPAATGLAVTTRSRPRRLRVGIVWAAGDWRRERSLPPPLLMPLARLPLDLVCLQLGPARHDPSAAALLRTVRVSRIGGRDDHRDSCLALRSRPDRHRRHNGRSSRRRPWPAGLDIARRRCRLALDALSRG